MAHEIILECLSLYYQQMAIASCQETPIAIELVSCRPLTITFVAAAEFIISWKEKLCCLSIGKEKMLL